MSQWARAKTILELDWRTEWREIATRLQGAQPAEVIGLVLAMDQAYHQCDKSKFLEIKSQLVKHRSWTGSKPSCAGNPDAKSAKPTGAPTVLALPI